VRVTHAFRLAMAREPGADELRVLLSVYEKLLRAYRQDPKAALKLLGQGAAARDKMLDPAEVASYTGVASLLLNLDETITKE
jgi:hypothetical protein